MKKALFLLLSVLMGYVAMANNDLYEWRKFENATTVTDIYGHEVDLAAELSAGKCLLIEYALTLDAESWERHQAGILEALQYQFPDQLCVLWVAIGDVPLDWIQGSAQSVESQLSRGDWTAGMNNTPVNYHVVNNSQSSSMNPFSNVYLFGQGVFFFAPSGYCCDLNDLSNDVSDAVLQVMRLIYNYPQEGQLAEIEITGPECAALNVPEIFEVNVTYDGYITGLEWSTATNNILSCTDCGNPRVTFTSRSGNWVDCKVSTQYGITRKRVHVDLHDSWESGSTVSYCMDEEYKGCLSAGAQEKEYGIRLERGMMGNYNSLVAVELYVNDPGDYTINVYKGDASQPGELIYTMTSYIPQSSPAWIRFRTATLPINNTDYMWITVNSSRTNKTGSYADYACTPFASMYREVSVWKSYRDRAWMIKAVLSDREPEAIDFTLDGPDEGEVNETYTYSVSGPEDATYTWEIEGGTPSEATGMSVDVSWSLSGHYDVKCVASKNGMTATESKTVAISYFQCSDMRLPYEEDFNGKSIAYCWNSLDEDNDGQKWRSSTQFFSSAVGRNGTACAASASYYNGQPLTPDNWLISQEIVLPEGPVTIEWWDKAQDADDYAEHYAVLLSSGSNTPREFTTVLYEGTVSQPQTWRKHQATLPDMPGQTVYLAFRHYDCTGQFFLLIDDVKLYVGEGEGGDNGDDNPQGIDAADGIAATIYPNPTNDVVHIEAAGIESVELIDMTGRSLTRTVCATGSSAAEIDLGNCSAGLYFLRITTQAGVTTKQVMRR